MGILGRVQGSQASSKFEPNTHPGMILEINLPKARQTKRAENTIQDIAVNSIKRLDNICNKQMNIIINNTTELLHLPALKIGAPRSHTNRAVAHNR